MKSDIIHFVHKVPVILFIIIIGAVFQSQSSGKELSGAQKEIWKMEEKFWDTWKKEGGASLKAFYHKEAIIWGSNAVWPQDRTYTSSGYYYEAGTNPIESFKLTLHEIRNFGNVSVVQYDAEVVNFVKKHVRFRISNSWMKQDGKWVIIGAMHGSCSNLPKCFE
jgi:hypothetical protein